jgi:hypothetical protein
MSVSVIDYTDASQMLADYAARRARMYGVKPALVERPVPTEPKADLADAAEAPERPAAKPMVAYAMWTKEEKLLLRTMAANGFNAKDISAELKRSVGAVKDMSYKLEVKIPPIVVAPKPKPDKARLARERESEIAPDRMIARQIIRHVADDLDISVPMMLGDCRQPFSVSARHQAIWMIARDTTLSLSQIGRIFSDRDHTAILHAIRRQNELRGANVRNAGVVSEQRKSAMRRYHERKRKERGA